MKRFLTYCLLFGIPFFLLIASYFIIDPFKVVRHYDNYYVPGDGRSVNRNYASAMTYVQQEGTYHYDSFIIGNSRSLFYNVEHWQQYLPEGSSCFHFDEFAGTVGGMYYKLRYIDQTGGSLRNVLFIWDSELLAYGYMTDRQYANAPVLEPGTTYAFHRSNLLAWIDFKRIKYTIQYMLTHRYSPGMEHYIARGINYAYYDLRTNEMPSVVQDSLIRCGAFFDDALVASFSLHQYPDSIAPQAIKGEKLCMMSEMADILRKHHTQYRIVISPLYNQIRIHPLDLKTLQQLFGADNVFDFSGVNQWTSDYHNFYERQHYTTRTATQIMDSVYTLRPLQFDSYIAD